MMSSPPVEEARRTLARALETFDSDAAVQAWLGRVLPPGTPRCVEQLRPVDIALALRALGDASVN